MPSDEQTFVDVKSITETEHIELRNEALNLYFNDLYSVLYGIEPISDPISIIKQVYAIYASLNNSFHYYDNHEAAWKFEELTEVNND